MSTFTGVDDVLKSLEQQYNGTKTASAAPVAETPSATAEKRAAVDDVLSRIVSAVSPEKTAAAQTNGVAPEDATSTMRKMAQEIEYAETAATLKQADLFGAAVCDSFVRRANQYAAASAPVKTASAATEFTADQVKLAQQVAAQGSADTEQMVYKLAAAAGNTETAQTVNEKVAGNDDGIGELANACHHSFNAGYAQIAELINAR